MAKKSKSNKWFVPVRGSYLPNNKMGWLTYIPFVSYLVFAWAIGWRDTDSASMAVLFIVPNWVAAVVIMTWIAKRTS